MYKVRYYGLNKNGCEVITKDYKVNYVEDGLDKFDNFIRKNNIKITSVCSEIIFDYSFI